VSVRRVPATDLHAQLAMHLGAFGRLSDDDLANLSNCIARPRRCAIGVDVRHEASDSPGPWVILMGWVGEGRELSDGRRQLFAVRLPGDVLDPSRGPADMEVTALTTVIFAELRGLDILLTGQALRNAWRAMHRAERDALYDQVLRLGRLSAFERTAHLLLELQERLQRVGMANALEFSLPVSQKVLGDVLGLSIVQVNRTWQQLRREELISGQLRDVLILDRERLAQIANYGLSHKPVAQELRPTRLS